jgi:hypothetical protein
MDSRSISISAGLLALVLLPAGCKKDSPSNPSNSDYANAINAYWSTHPTCLWPDSVKMPTQQDTNKDDRTAAYDALTDSGFLQRMQAEKKVFIFGSKQVSDYDLTAQGRTVWVPDPQQPGYGNFCFGHRTVNAISAVTPLNAANPNLPASATISYQYTIADAAAWVKNAEIQTAFPSASTAIAGPQPDTATLTKTTAGWQMTAPKRLPPSSSLSNPANDNGVVGDH